MYKRTAVIIGSSISGCMAACQIKQDNPDLNVILIGKKRNTPIVGESLTEYSTQFFRNIGMSEYLEENHYHKYGLTFYFKENLNDKNNKRYAAHEPNAIPHLPSKQLNRHEMDKQLLKIAQDKNCIVVDGWVKDIQIYNKFGKHKITFEEKGESKIIDADFIVDCSGRSRILAKKLNLQKTAPTRRSSFWFRLKNFDRKLLFDFICIKENQIGYNSYYVTHHFIGNGNWIWCIPLKSKDEDLISIGIIFRPDMLQKEITCMDDFYHQVESEHPHLSKFVQSGEVVDTNVYGDYFYQAKQFYSAENWFIVGDAGNTVDPLYSTGIVMTSIQVTQVSKIIQKTICNTISNEFIQDLENVFVSIYNAGQEEIGQLYEVMHDPYQSSWRIHYSSLFYFYVLLPNYLNDNHTNQQISKLLHILIEFGRGEFQYTRDLLKEASCYVLKNNVDMIPNQYKSSVNWPLMINDQNELKFNLLVFLKYLKSFHSMHIKQLPWQNRVKHIQVIGKFTLLQLLIRFYMPNGNWVQSKRICLLNFVLAKIKQLNLFRVFNFTLFTTGKPDLH